MIVSTFSRGGTFLIGFLFGLLIPTLIGMRLIYYYPVLTSATAVSMAEYNELYGKMGAAEVRSSEISTAMDQQNKKLEPTRKLLLDHSLSALSVYEPAQTPPSNGGIYIEFSWDPEAPEGATLALFDNQDCHSFDQKNPPSELVTLTKDQNSYRRVAQIISAAKFCGQIWKDYPKGIPVSDPATYVMPEIPYPSRAVDDL